MLISSDWLGRIDCLVRSDLVKHSASLGHPLTFDEPTGHRNINKLLSFNMWGE